METNKHYVDKGTAAALFMGRPKLLPKMGEEKDQPGSPCQGVRYVIGQDADGYYTQTKGGR